MPYSDEELLDEIQRVAATTPDGESPTLQDFRTESDIADTTILRRFGSWQDAVVKAGFEPQAPTTEIPDDDLLAELHRLADAVGRVPTMAQMNEQGAYAASTYKNHFGSWSEALAIAFDESTEAGATVSNADLLAELRRVAADHRDPPRFEDMRAHGQHRARTYTDRFGSWSAAVEAAGLDPIEQRIPTGDLIGDLHRLKDQLGAQPTSTDVVEHGEYGLATYQRRFGSWSAAVNEAFSE